MRRILLGVLLVSCGGSGIDAAATINPLYLITLKVLGPSVKVERLVPPGANPHLYEPKPSDLRKAHEAKLLVFGGDLLEPWAAKVEGPLKVDAYQVGKGTGGDPHVWLDPERGALIAKAVAEAGARLWPERRWEFQRRLENLTRKLDSLDRWFKEELAKKKDKRFVAVHPAFDYLCARYGLEQVAVLERAPGAEPKPRELERVARMMREEGVKLLLATPETPEGLLKIFKSETKAHIAVIDPLGRDASSYSELLEQIFSEIVEALE